MAVATLQEVFRDEGRVAELMGVINAATAELVRVIAEVDAAETWMGDGIRSLEHWVAWHCGVSGARAARLVHMARRREELPLATGAFTAGEISEDQAAVVYARVGPENDRNATDLARYATVSQLRRTIPRPPTPPTPPTPEGPGPVAHDEVRFGWAENGRWWCRADLDPDLGALVEKSLLRARDAEFALRFPGAEPGQPEKVTWVDALMRLAETNLAELAGSGRPGDRYQVLVHVRADAPAAAVMHLGPPLPDTLRRYLTCDATMRWVLEQGNQLLGLSRRQATVDDRTRTLIEHRDQGCRVPGCGQRRWLHIHHLIHREDGGETVPENLIALCPYHHRLHHRGQLVITGDPTTPDGVSFLLPDGRDYGPSPPRPPNQPPRDAASQLGLSTAPYRGPTGERLERRWVSWNMT